MSEPMTLHLLPEDISAEEVLTYMPRGSFRVSFDGPHKRASYNDILGIDSDLAGKLRFIWVAAVCTMRCPNICFIP